MHLLMQTLVILRFTRRKSKTVDQLFSRRERAHGTQSGQHYPGHEAEMLTQHQTSTLYWLEKASPEGLK